MFKIRKTGWLLGLALALLFQIGLAPAETTRSINQITSVPVTAGVNLESYNYQSGSRQIKMYVLKVDLTNPYVVIDTLIGQNDDFEDNENVTDMANRKGAAAAINGDFFQMGTTGQPIGLTYHNGSLISSPALRNDMYGFGLYEKNLPYIGVFSFSGSVKAPNGDSYSLAGINKPTYLVQGGASSDTNALQMYNSGWGDYSRGGGGDGVEMVVRNGLVTEIRNNQAAIPIPGDGYILRGEGSAAQFLYNNFAAGSEVQFSYSVEPGGDLQTAIGGQACLVETGIIPNYFTQEVSGTVARTSVGYTQDQKTVYLTVGEKSSQSDGLTQWEMAYFMQSLGCWWAVNLDGGGSTTMSARSLGESSVSQVNTPQGGSERNIPTALGIFSTAPAGKLAGLVFGDYTTNLLTGVSYSFPAKGYDEYYNPYAGEISTKVVDGTGSVANNQVTFTDGGTALVSVGNADYQEEITLNVYDDERISYLQIEPASKELAPQESVSFTVKAISKDGLEFTLDANNYQVSLVSGQGTVSGNTYTAPDTVTEAKLAFSFGEVRQEATIKVVDSKQLLGIIDAGESTVLNFANLSLTFPDGALPGGTTVVLKALEQADNLPDSYQFLGGVEISTSSSGLTLASPLQISETTGKTETKILQWQEGAWTEIVEGQSSSLNPLIVIQDTQFLFTDLIGHWAETDVVKLAQAGIVSGYPGHLFKPSTSVTRAQFSTMLAKVMGWNPNTNLSFSDQAQIPDWARGYIGAAVSQGVISGYANNTFRPNQSITRSEMAAMITKALNLEAQDSAVLRSFQDYYQIADWALKPLASLVEIGIMKGNAHSQIQPKGTATRAEGTVLLARTQEYLTVLDKNSGQIVAGE